MKYIYLILICFLSVATQAQVQKQPRSNFPTVVDSSLAIGKNFIIPVFRSLSDLAKYQVLDSTGRIMYLRDSNAVFVRNNAHQWVKLATSIGSGGGWQLTGNAITSGDFFGTTNNQPLDVRADGVTLMMLDGNTKIVTIGDVNTTASGVTLTVDATDNGSYNFNKPYFTISGVEYVFPSTQGTNGSILTNDGNGVLKWAYADTLPDRLVRVGLSLVDSTVFISNPVFIRNDSIDSISGTFSYVIHYIDSGYIRQTLFFINSGNNIDSLQGVADTANIAPPPLPTDGIAITIVTQVGDVVYPPIPAVVTNYWSTDGLNFIPNTSPSVFGVANNRNVSFYQNSAKRFSLDSAGGVKFYDSLVMAEINPSVVGAMDSRTIKLRAKGSTGNLQEARIYVNGFGGSNGAALNFASDNGFMQFRATLPEFQFVGNARIGGSTGADFFVRNPSSGATVTNDLNQSSGNLFAVRKSNGAAYKSYMAMNFDGRVVLEDSVTSAPAASAIMDMRSVAKGFLKPRMTGVQMNAIVSPATGLEVYNTDSAATCYWNGSLWVKVGSGGGSSSPDTLVVVDPLYSNIPGDTLRIKESSETQSGVATASQVILWNDAAINTWKTTGNSGTDASINYAGTSDSVDYVVRTNNTEVARFGTNLGNVSMGVYSSATGEGSAAIGLGSTASGAVSVALGQSTAVGSSSLSSGAGSFANGAISSAFGSSTSTYGVASSSFGYSTTANGDNSIAIGDATYSNSRNSLVIGRYNDTTGQVTNDSSILFQIGNGYASDAVTVPSNIMTVTYNGVGIGTTTPTYPLDVNGAGRISGRGIVGEDLSQSYLFQVNNNAGSEFLKIDTSAGQYLIGDINGYKGGGQSIFQITHSQASLISQNNQYILVDNGSHSMDLGDIDGWGNNTYVAIEDDDQQVRINGNNGLQVSGGGISILTGTLTSPIVAVSGTGGNGYINLLSQSSMPSTPASGNMKFYADANGRLAWLTSLGFQRSFRSYTLTANRVYNLQDKDYTLADSADVATKKNISDSAGLGSNSGYATGYAVNKKIDSVNTARIPLSSTVSVQDTTVITVAKNSSLSVSIGANKKYKVVFTLYTNCDTTTGIRVGLSGPSGSAISSGSLIGSNVSNGAPQIGRLSAMGGLSGGGVLAFNRATALAGILQGTIFITTSSTPGTLTLIFAAGALTTAKPAYIQVGSTMEVSENQ